MRNSQLTEGINMNSDILNSIREAEKESHLEVYSTAKLFEIGSWLQKPVKTVLDILPCFKNYKELKVLDLGCGVGRNCIPIAQEYRFCKIDCIDILDYAIDKLNENSVNYGVNLNINGIVSSIDDFCIQEKHYDFILAISALEHINSVSAFTDKLIEICNGTKKDGIVCLIINSEINEINKETGQSLVPQFEVNLKTEELLNLLGSTFDGWKILKNTIRTQKYDIPRKNCVADLTTDVVTFVARK